VSESVVLSVDGGVAEIRFNRPDRLNAIDMAISEGFHDAVRRGLADPAVRAVLLSGEGRAFVAGGDLGLFRAAQDRPAAARAQISPMNEALAALYASGLPTVAALKGAVAGAGMSLALAVDLAVAADNTKFSFAYIKVAANPDCGGSWVLPRLVGLRRALEIALLSEPIDAATALDLGLVNKVVPLDAVEDEARALARRLAEGPAEAIRNTKALIRQASAEAFAAHLGKEMDGFAALSATSDFHEALEAFFGKRPPRFGANPTE
jgi:2-(1,2-epoxy-1,2-dihydrophenyl)acetyl-CoA isomerase